ncbi:MAG: hypothetical protein K2N25_09400, partial [Muribaculaceae bacterium]|nr:hypothetical protein [Muribaculaceae bacterium]
PEKTYFLAQAQLYDQYNSDNAEHLYFLFVRDKETGEVMPYNIQNYLNGSLIKTANYNARKNYLLLVYDDYTIDILHDDGKVSNIKALKSYDGNFSKEVRSIMFDPDHNRAYLATDFGFIIIDDEKSEVVSSGIYNQPIDKMLRVADNLVILRDKRLYSDDISSPHLALSDFKEVDWGGPGEAGELYPLTSDRCLISRSVNGQNVHYIMNFDFDKENPQTITLWNLDNSNISENKNGLLIARYGDILQLDRNATTPESLKRRSEEFNQICGSWDFKDFYYSSPREGFYSLRREADGSWTVTSQPARPNAPAVFRCTNMLYSPAHGMMVNTHGINQNFSSRMAKNPILLSGIRDREWTMYGLPYIDKENFIRFINPGGIAQDPDNPDVFYFGSVHNGLLRYDVKDASSVLHFTKSDDSPALPGHVTLMDPYPVWSNTCMLLSPVFDSRGNLLVAHVNTEKETYKMELWMWEPGDRRATTSPETFQPFTRLKVNDIVPDKANLVLPLAYQGNQDMVVLLSIDTYNRPIVVYDHNGTPKADTDDRQATMKKLQDSDGELDFSIFYCAVEDPATGLVWVGTNNGVFTFDPKDAFTDPTRASRIKVSRNDGTSLADYLLSGTSVNDISIDAQGRKWFSINGGGLVCTSADGKTILQEINGENSLLPSDQVYISRYNPDNNSMMIATSAGLCEYYLSGQVVEEVSSTVRAYPNPVRHDYYGWVTIDGLEDDAIVKIADSAGNLVRELGPAVAGKVQWDVCGFDLNRVPSGVYFVLISSGPSGGSYSEATKILVINR